MHAHLPRCGAGGGGCEGEVADVEVLLGGRENRVGKQDGNWAA